MFKLSALPMVMNLYDSMKQTTNATCNLCNDNDNRYRNLLPENKINRNGIQINVTRGKILTTMK